MLTLWHCGTLTTFLDIVHTSDPLMNNTRSADIAPTKVRNYHRFEGTAPVSGPKNVSFVSQAIEYIALLQLYIAILYRARL